MNATIFEAEILAGTVPKQEGKLVFLYYPLGSNGEETEQHAVSIGRLAVACQLILPESLDAEIEAIEFENAQFVVRVVAFTKNGKRGRRVSDVWSINDPRVSTVPKNLDAVRLWNEARAVSEQ